MNDHQSTMSAVSPKNGHPFVNYPVIFDGKYETCEALVFHSQFETVSKIYKIIIIIIVIIIIIMIIWLVVSTHLKNISQNGNLPQIGVTIKHI